MKSYARKQAGEWACPNEWSRHLRFLPKIRPLLSQRLGQAGSS
ncbi:hypothetical protein AvCA_27800 [Azotobacter vinelandii CA]|uniref:Uncharacterized protein n=2 Tax=Azotobacter vinelandii TaxID=354 RepID=C1DKV0_AZOVD|nr:hypothetical protein Avin_27800 [Azotobacter vinelandii DJ]AGK14851.1 hypothetical protein AvCA_27800 [Azotobacter vinelandii CA]AGK20870.1 hypothetical protein AvCA6_27800 [Azotobacter vinelandii CA6]